jgi:hypothetical protein
MEVIIQRGKFRPLPLAIFALLILYICGFQVAWPRLILQVEGKVVSSQDVPSTGAPRYATYYLIQAPNGQIFPYVAGCTDASLPRSLPVGTNIIKRRWEWKPRLNGAGPSDNTTIFYLAASGTAIGCLAWCTYRIAFRSN